jgi:2-dehydro-3-deoxyphosphooctonate aldolase (KDO 8-P synthase)
VTAVQVGPLSVGGGQLALIAGPCAIEDEETTLAAARGLHEVTRALGVPWIFKASFDKANRTSGSSFRGVGIEEGLRVLARLKAELGCPVTTDVHEPAQAERVAEVVDLLQVPAFLCRQTDLLVACGRTGRAVNIKKGQFLAPLDMGHALDKVRQAGASGVLLTERGTSFGYHDLVVDYRGLVWMRSLGVPIVFDATHSTQRPSAHGDRSGGDHTLAMALGSAAVAVGVDAIFAEVHPDPARARSDADTQLPLAGFTPVLRRWLALHNTSMEKERVDRTP